MQSAITQGPARSTAPLHRNRSAVAILVGIIGFFLIWGAALSAGPSGGRASDYVNTYSVLLVLLCPMLVLLPIYGFAGIMDAGRWLVRRPAPGDDPGDAVMFFQLAAAFSMASGFLNMLVGLVISLTTLSGSSSLLGSGMALALLSQLYGVFAAVVCVAAAGFIARRHGHALSGAPLARRSAGVAGVTLIAGALTTLIVFCILLLSARPNL